MSGRYRAEGAWAHAVACLAIAPLLAIAGLLTFPTSCTCGASEPHEHALFALAGHTHAGSDLASHVRHSSHENPPIASDITVEALSTVAAGNAFVAALTSGNALNEGGVVLPASLLDHQLIGVATTPESPPPRA